MVILEGKSKRTEMDGIQNGLKNVLKLYGKIIKKSVGNRQYINSLSLL